MNFWQLLPKPIIGLAPMDGVSDAAFRFINAKYGKPDVIITEFISVDGIAHSGDHLFSDFLYSEIERPVVAQVFGIDPQLFYLAAQVVCDLGFDGIDINMGCPAKNVSHRGAGAGLIRNPALAKEIVLAVKQGVQDWVKGGPGNMQPKLQARVAMTKEKLSALGVRVPIERDQIPVSVKTRIGYDSVVVEEWMQDLLEVTPANISLHGRTLKQGYSGVADWQAIAKAAAVVANYNKNVAAEARVSILGNGDVTSADEAVRRIAETGVDGVLIGRGAFGNPWIFNSIPDIRQEKKQISSPEISLAEKIKVLLEHADKLIETKGEHSFVQMRKHLGWYIKGIPGAADARRQLMVTNSVAEVRAILATLVEENKRLA